MWYKINEISSNLFHITEPNHVSFYIMRTKDYALLIDSGLGIAPSDFQQILKNLGIKTFDVLATHLHCDHVGSNHLANKVFVNDKELKKYQNLNDEVQILSYFDLLKNQKDWPSSVSSKTKDFSTKIEYIEQGKVKIGGNELEAICTPGHTCGHMVYISQKYQCIFMGDLLYDGLLFINLPDSDLDSYLTSLETIWELTQKLGFTLLPSHNTIPLSIDYLPKAIDVLQKIRAGEINGFEVPKNSIFDTSIQFSLNGVKVQVTKGTEL
jgi:glyoxylase-like metal-dependent hydrolase (beta-lactamase superfamily II)